MRILSLDYGEKRIGVAVSDELGIAAHGVATLTRKNREADMTALAFLIEDLKIEKIVIGYPKRIDGSEGIQCEKVSRFIKRIENRFHLPVIRWDESFSTKEAEDIIRNHRQGKRKKMTVDRIAASVILQDYLDSLDTEGRVKTIRNE